jgi:transcriptional regulator with GAF, ATPase, and Fis domain
MGVLLRRESMSSQVIWGIQPDDVARAAARGTEVVLDNRLTTLRDVALTLLREVESLRVTEPYDLVGRVRLNDEVQRFETELIRSALSRTMGNQTRAARLLGVKLTTLNSKIKRYGISIPSYDVPEHPEIAA